MPEWLIVVLALVTVPLAAILGTVYVVGLVIRVWHRTKLEKLELEEKQRQAETDRELLGLGSSGLSAHVETLLDRMKAVEDRLGKIEAIASIEAARARTPIPIASGDPQRPEQRDQQTQK